MKSSQTYTNEIAKFDLTIIESYKGSKTAIRHKCSNGHIFVRKPEHVLSGRAKCPDCRQYNVKSNHQYLEELFYKDIITLPLEPYIKNNIAISHEGECGHVWKAAPNEILRGSGCPECSNTSFNRQEKALLYCIYFQDLYKIGVTNKDCVKLRFPGEWNRLRMQLQWQISFDKGYDAISYETKLKQANKEFIYIGKPILTRGNTELFTKFIARPNL